MRPWWTWRTGQGGPQITHSMSVRDILHHLQQVYGTQLSHETVSRITDAVLEEVRARQIQSLDPAQDLFPASRARPTQQCRFARYCLRLWT